MLLTHADYVRTMTPSKSTPLKLKSQQMEHGPMALLAAAIAALMAKDAEGANPVGICFRRCGSRGWARSLAIRAEGEEEDASKIEEDKFFGMPLGYGMGWQLMAPPMYMMSPTAFGLPQSFGFFNPSPM